MTALDTNRQQLYSQGKTAVYSFSGDHRVSYCLYVPARAPGSPQPGLVIPVHHSLRNFMQCRDTFADFATRNNMVVLAPLFPVNVLGDGNPDGYKYLIESDIRYDLLLDGMIELVAKQTGCRSDKFCMFGFSGGGHFTHRYLLTRPERFIAASIGAPGQVTLLNPDADWWVGTRNMKALFGRPLNLDALRKVPVQMIVGENDIETHEFTHSPDSQYYRPESAATGATRVERLRSLQRSFESAGVSVQFDLMPGVAHISVPAMELAQAFFEKTLKEQAAK
jgi:dienelactone hydrolase